MQRAEDVFNIFVLQSFHDEFRSFHSFVRRNRSALVMTETELKLMATPAIMGLSNTPKNG